MRFVMDRRRLIVLVMFVFFLLVATTFLSGGGSGQDPYMGGLLLDAHINAAATDLCSSRSEHHLYRGITQYGKPSPYLLSKLRDYEKLHQRCAGKAAEWITQLVQSQNESKKNDSQVSGCNFVVWINDSGLGNKMMTLVATFLYALVTGRLMLVDRAKNMDKLFCEPFPNGPSWFLQTNRPGSNNSIGSFPREWLLTLNYKSPLRFGGLLAQAGACIIPSALSESMVTFLELAHIYDRYDQRFFCEKEQELLKRVRVLFMRSNNYFVPGLYNVPAFRKEIEAMFPDRETVFHHLGRYLLHPADEVWSRITRFYDSYLAGSNLVVGLQMRTFDSSAEAIQRFSEQLLTCISERKILPRAVEGHQQMKNVVRRSTSKVSVLVTSLHRLYYDRLRDLYGRLPTEDGTLVSVHLPSSEGVQKTEEDEHDVKALAEIYLLSLADVRVTSPRSTFGYAAQSLAGFKGWVLEEDVTSGEKRNVSVCSLAASLEPCFHAPPMNDCDCEGGMDLCEALPGVLRHCNDVKAGTQLVRS